MYSMPHPLSFTATTGNIGSSTVNIPATLVAVHWINQIEEIKKRKRL